MASEGGKSSGHPVKVFLWSTPRSVSTTLLKCLTFVPDTSAWYEPYVQMAKFSLDDDPVFYGPFKGLVEKLGGRGSIDKIESGFDASDKTIDWLKEQLEGDFPGKKLVIVKDMGATITRPSPPLYDKIPKGFRHTFLMRHPSKIFNVKNVLKHNAGSFKNPIKPTPEKFRPYQYLNELWKYVKAQGIEARPIIMDADELLQNPKEVLEAYCKELGIPFSEELLSWEAGDEVMTKHWMVPKQTILTWPTIGMHDSSFSGTGFTQQSTVKPDVAASEQDGKDGNSTTPDVAAADEAAVKQAEQFVASILTREIPFYEEMYPERLKL